MSRGNRDYFYLDFLLLLLLFIAIAIAGILGVIAYELTLIRQSGVLSASHPISIDARPQLSEGEPIKLSPVELKLTNVEEAPSGYGPSEPNLLNVWNSFNEDYQYSVMPEGDNYRIFILHQFDVYVDQYNSRFEDKVGAVARGLRKLLIMSILVSEEGEIIKDKSWEFDLYHDLLADDFIAKFAKPELWPYYVREKIEAEK